MNYILVVDDEADIRDIYELVLKRAFPLDVVAAESGNKALSVIREKGLPSLIVSDLKMPDGDGYFLYSSIIENGWNIPFVICSTDARQAKAKFPDIHGYIEKPNVMKPLVELVTSLVTNHLEAPKFIPIRIPLLLRWGTTSFDLYLRLSDSKLIKVINAREAFLISDAERFQAKGLQHLLITATDADQYLSSLEKNISVVLASENAGSDMAPFAMESLESVEKIARSLGWQPQVLEAAKHAVNLAIKAVVTEPDILKLMKQKFSDPTSKYSGHVSLLSLLSCGLCYQLGWTSESTQMKLGLAALMHDLTVDETMYQDIMLWNQAAVDHKIKTPEAIKYRNHPGDAANLLLSMKNVPADVDQIILQHHEMKDGTGFPRGLNSSRITPMASLFIIAEDLINFLEDSDNYDEKVTMFLKHRGSIYNSGNFKKVFEAFKESVQKTRL